MILHRTISSSGSLVYFHRFHYNYYPRFSLYLSLSSIHHHHSNYIIERNSSSTDAVSKIQNNLERQGEQQQSWTSTLNLPKSKFPLKHSRLLELELEKVFEFVYL